jgi:hypothetical protein
MTQCTTDSMSFSRLRGKKIQADFNGGAITSDAGVLLLREVDKRIGLIDQINDCIADPRNPFFVTHTQRSMLAQRIMAIAQGYEDLNDHQTLKEDPLFQMATDRGIDPELPLASTTTLWRLEDRVNRRAMVKIVETFVDQFINSHTTEPSQIVLDFDATDDPLHGQQEGRFFHGYYDCYCYLPLYVFCGDQLLVPYLRPSNIDGAKHSWVILQLLVRRFRQVWPDVRVIFRGDSGFCRWKMMRWCDRHGVYYCLGLAKNPVLLRKVRELQQQAQIEFEQTGQTQRVLGSFSYGASTWDRKRRVIARIEHNAKGTNPRFIVSNLPGSPRQLYYEFYCARGDMENRIKEQQLWLFADRTSSQSFLSNQFRVLMSSAAYILLESLRRLGLKHTPLARAQSGTIRNKLLKIGARLVVSVRRIVLHLSTGYPYANLFRQIAARITGQVPHDFRFG